MGSRVAVLRLPGQSISAAGGGGVGARGVSRCRRWEGLAKSGWPRWPAFQKMRAPRRQWPGCLGEEFGLGTRWWACWRGEGRASGPV